MNKILKNITNEMFSADTDYFCKSVGNYRVVRNRGFIYHYYFGYRICLVDLNKKQFSLFPCGYENYRLTKAQLNYLQKFYVSKGYEFLGQFDIKVRIYKNKEFKFYD